MYKHIILGITGGIAAYKTPELARTLIRNGAEVAAVVTQNATHFVAPLSLQTVTQRPVLSDLFAPITDWHPQHIALADWADAMLVAPATANIIGKFASGIADDALSTLFLAFNKPVFIAPAMNTIMLSHPIVQRNIAILKEIGATFIDSSVGELACGATGKGRMADIETIVNQLAK